MPAPLIFDPDATLEHSHKFWRWFDSVTFALFAVGLAGTVRLALAGYLIGPGVPAAVEQLARGAVFLCLGIMLALMCAKPRCFRVREGEMVLQRFRLIGTMKSMWWGTLLVWPAYVAGVLMLFRRLFDQQVQPVAAGDVLFNLLCWLGFAFLTSLMFFAVHEIRADGEGIRATQAYFAEWRSISRVVDVGPHFEVFHIAYPTPIVTIPKTDEQVEAFFRDQLSKQGVLLEIGAPADMRVEIAMYVIGAVALLAATLAFLSNDALSVLYVVAMSFFVGLVITAQILNFRGFSKVTRIIPPIDRASLRLKPGETLPPPKPGVPPIPEP